LAFSYLTPDNLFRRYTAAKRYTDQLTRPFPEFQRIASNKPFQGLDPNYPEITDGTTASIIRKTPRRVVQQLPTGKVENDSEDWLSIVADFILTNKIIPFANEEYDLIQKCWTALEDGLTFGSAFTYTPFLNHDGYFCPDLIHLYWGDIAVQPGKKSFYSCNYFFMRSWWQPEDIEALIDKENNLASSAKDRGEKYESTWDLKALKQAKDMATTKDTQAKTPTEDDRALDATGIELITAFQKGVGAKFYTFTSKENLIVRTEENQDPRGRFPVDAMYGDVDGTNPLGRGLPELIGPLQNFIDSEMQLHGYNRALMLAPPLVKYGTFNKKKVVYQPNAVIDVGSDPTAKVVALDVDTSALQNYPALYGLHKSQLLNLVNSPDTSISSDVGNPGFSKTPAGVNQQKSVISIDDNYVRKMFEAWFENWAETAINLYFAKRSGIEELQLDEETAERLKKLAEQGKFDMSQLNEDNMIRIDYDTATPALKFRVDASTSKMKDDADQLQALTSLANEVGSNPLLMQLLQQYPEKLIGLWNSIISNSGVEDPEDLEIDVKQFQAQQAQAQEAQAQQAQMQQQAQVQPQGQPMPQDPQAAPQQPGEEPQLVTHLRQLDVPDQQIRAIVSHALRQGQGAPVNG
jgi:hypothetical protein